MVVFAIMLFIVGFNVGKKIEEQEAIAEKEKEKDEAYTEVYSPSDLNQSVEESQEEHEHYEYFNPEVDKKSVPEEKSSTLSDYFSKKDIERSRNVAEGFIKAYYPFDGNNPLENIENAKEYMLGSLYERFKEFIAKPTQTIFRKELKNIEVYEPYDPPKDYIKWNVKVTGEVFDTEGNITKEETYTYSLQIIKDNDSFKVQDFSLNLAD